MAKTVIEAFDSFLKDIVNLDPDETKKAKGSREWLVGQINSFPDDQKFSQIYTDRNIFYGSFSRSTKKRPLDDIDLMICKWIFDIVPCFFTAEDENKRQYYLIPDGAGNWKMTDPRIDSSRLVKINTFHDGNILNVIRSVKYWNKRATMPSMDSYLLENMILDYYSEKTTKAQKWVDMELVDVFL